MKRTRDSKLTAADIEACDRLRSLWELRPKDVTQDTVGELMGGITQGAVSQYLTHRSRLNYRAVMAFAKALGVTPSQIRSDLPEQKLDQPFLRPISVWDEASDLPADRFVFFPKLEYRWSCGNGGPDHDSVEATDKTLPFTTSWVQREGWSPKTHFTMRAAGDSMEPTIQDKAPVVVDISEAGKVVRSGSIYAIKIDGEPLLKRLDKLPGGRVRVRADNPSPSYAAFEVDEGQIEVVGRAVWTPVRL